MAWPATLLSSSNRQLAAEAEELERQLQSRREACDEARDVVFLMRDSHAQARTIIAATESDLATRRLATERAESEAKTARNECEKTTKEVQRWEAEAARMAAVSRQSQAALSTAQQGLSVAIATAATLEEEARAALHQRLSMEKTGAELEAAVGHLSRTVWSRLAGLSGEVRQRQWELQGAQEQHGHVLTELTAVRDSLREAARDQRGSIRELAALHAQSAAADAAIAVNAAAMQAMAGRAAARQSLRGRLDRAVHALRLEARVAAKAAEAKRRSHDTALAGLRQVVDSLRGQAGQAETVRRHRAACVQHAMGLAGSLAHLNTLASERAAAVEQQGEYEAQLRVLLVGEVVEKGGRATGGGREGSTTATVASLATLYAAHATLQWQLAKCDDRLERASAAVAASVSAMVAEGRRGEGLQAATSLATHSSVKLSAEHEGHAAALAGAVARLAALDSGVGERQEVLPGLWAESRARLGQQRRQAEAAIGRIRERLHGATDTHRQLLRANTALRGSLRRAAEGLEARRVAVGADGAAAVLLAGEVPRLEVELAGLEERHGALRLEYATAHAAFDSMRAAADGQVGALQAAAGAGERLRAVALGEEARLAADMHGALVELRLHQAALREQGEELRRQARRRDLVRGRYTELMQSIVRATRAPLMEQRPSTGNGDATMPSLGALDEGDMIDAAPEALHARLLLLRSYERERLMEKGNYLDLRLVSLERETATLKGMREAMRNEGGGAGARAALLHANPNAATPAEMLSGKPTAIEAAGGERLRLMRAELALQEAALAAMHEQGELTRGQAKTMRGALSGLQGADRQRRLQLQRVRDQVHRERQRGLLEEGKRLAKKMATPPSGH